MLNVNFEFKKSYSGKIMKDFKKNYFKNKQRFLVFNFVCKEVGSYFFNYK